ncbi:MAG TPA: amino acid permease, partial [Patescibacteria group bacterium]|nr:amino acid permease [Patescibacteria group bacterium]
VYLREAWGGLPAFLYGWKCLLVMDPGLTAALAAGFAAYVGVLVPLSPSGIKLVGITTVLALAAANLRGTPLAAGIIRLLTAGKLYLLGLLVFSGFISGLGDWGHFLPLLARRPGSAPLLPALAGAVVVAFFSFGGWWEMSKIAGEVREPSKTLPRAFALGIGLVTLAYILTSAVFLYLVPIESMASGETFAAQAATVLLGPPGAKALAALVALCILSSLATITTLCPRVYYAMARDGSFLAAVGRLDPRTGTPVRAIIVQTVLACLLLMIGTFDQIMAYFIFVTVAFLGLSVAGLFVIRRRGGSAPGFATPGFPLPAVVFLGSLVVVLVLLAGSSPMQAALGAGVVALGAPAFYLMRRFA